MIPQNTYLNALQHVMAGLPDPDTYQGLIYKDTFNNHHFTFSKDIEYTTVGNVRLIKSSKWTLLIDHTKDRSPVVQFITQQSKY